MQQLHIQSLIVSMIRWMHFTGIMAEALDAEIMQRLRQLSIDCGYKGTHSEALALPRKTGDIYAYSYNCPKHDYPGHDNKRH